MRNNCENYKFISETIYFIYMSATDINVVANLAQLEYTIDYFWTQFAGYFTFRLIELLFSLCN